MSIAGCRVDDPTPLLSLPDEILVEIIRYLDRDRPEPEISPRFWDWAAWCQDGVQRRKPSRRVRNLHALMLSSRRLHRLVEPLFYKDVLVGKYGQARTKFFAALEQNPQLWGCFQSVVVDCDDSMEHAARLFWAPNCRTLTLVDFNDWHALGFTNMDHVGTSPIERLHLASCGAKEEALAAVLSWPAALKSLHYDADQGQWRGHYEGEPIIEWTCAAFVRSLQPQKATLKELTMTGPPLVHEGLFTGPRIDLHDFTALSTLRIFDAFLCGNQDSCNAWKGLPPSLEVLDVFYDDAFYTGFFEGYEHRDWSGGQWLLELLQRKEKHFPKLSKVTIHTPELDRNEDLGPQRRKYMYTWTLPTFLAAKCESVGVELTVLMEYEDLPVLEDFDALDLLAVLSPGYG